MSTVGSRVFDIPKEFEMFNWFIASLTRRDREVVDFTRSRVKNYSELTNLGIKSELKGIMVNKGRIHRELRYF